MINDLGTLPGGSSSHAYFVNDRGQVVGTSEDRAHMLIGVGEHAFLWEDGGPMVDLNSLIPAGSSLQLTYAVAINDRGEIAGFGVSPGVPPEKYETDTSQRIGARLHREPATVLRLDRRTAAARRPGRCKM